MTELRCNMVASDRPMCRIDADAASRSDEHAHRPPSPGRLFVRAPQQDISRRGRLILPAWSALLDQALVSLRQMAQRREVKSWWGSISEPAGGFAAGGGRVSLVLAACPCGERLDGGGDGLAAESLEVVEGVLGAGQLDKLHGGVGDGAQGGGELAGPLDWNDRVAVAVQEQEGRGVVAGVGQRGGLGTGGIEGSVVAAQADHRGDRRVGLLEAGLVGRVIGGSPANAAR